MPARSTSASSGFTLIELVSVIVLLGILSVTVAPKFFGSSSSDEYAVRDQIYSLFHFARQRALDDHSNDVCYSVRQNSNQWSAARNGTTISTAEDLGIDLNDYPDVSVSTSTGTFFFDKLGNLYTGNDLDCGTSPITTLNITISGAKSLILRLHSTGYVQRL